MKNEGLTFRRKPTLDRLSMRVFCDANFAGEPPESTHAAMRSTSAFQIVLDGIGTILILSKQQTTVAKSTFEAEYRCASHAAQVQQGYINVLGQLGEVVQSPTPFAIDNTATMRAITTQATSFKLRHLLLDHAYLREQYHRGNIVPVHIDGTANPADIGTKNLPADSTERYATYILDAGGDNKF